MIPDDGEDEFEVGASEPCNNATSYCERWWEMRAGGLGRLGDRGSNQSPEVLRIDVQQWHFT
jgi:hypothetical protein